MKDLTAYITYFFRLFFFWVLAPWGLAPEAFPTFFPFFYDLKTSSSSSSSSPTYSALLFALLHLPMTGAASFPIFLV